MKQGYLLFHLNILFSSISEKDYPIVIEKCYWPILRLCERLNTPVNVELSKVTYDIINQIDPLWIAKLHNLSKLNLVEIVQCGYTQLIGPLVPEKLLRANICNGIDTGKKINTFLVNEMALDFKTLKSYRELGVGRIIFEEESIARSRNCLPRDMTWSGKLRIDSGRPQSIVWSSSMLFQQFQRYIHGQTNLEEYMNFLEKDFASRKYIAVYSSDAETFNFRPGRFKEEEKIVNDEWSKIEQVITRLKEKIAFVRLCDLAISDDEIEIDFNIQCPVFVKKQDKYNLVRWSVTGRNDSSINSKCLKTYKYFDQMTMKERLKLIYLWTSDFRTHIEVNRWEKYYEILSAFTEEMNKKYIISVVSEEYKKKITGVMKCELNESNGSIHALFSNKELAIKSIYHKDFLYTDEAADFYSGGLTVFNQNTNRIHTDYTDGERLESESNDGCELLNYFFSNSDFEAFKSVMYSRQKNEVCLNWFVKFSEEANRTIRFCNFLIPRSILSGLSVCDDYTSTYLSIDWKNGILRPKSSKISSLQSIPLPLGSTLLYLKNGSKLQFTVDDCEAMSCAMLLNFNQHGGKDYYRLSFSVSEMDDTSKIRAENIEFKVRISSL
ncbi:MAG: hypothetical protein P8I57_01430 [Amylibacter sp.]|nr:hypothetical protein [Amylibacter sp.]